MIPEHRLARLLDQIRDEQIAGCLYHDPHATLSLFTEHSCDRNEYPLRKVQELDEYDGEVYAVEYSHNGEMIACSGSSARVLIYDTATWKVKHRGQEHVYERR